MHPLRLPALRLSALAAAVALTAGAAQAQSNNTDIAGTWSTDAGCAPGGVRVTFGASDLAIERNGRRVFASSASFAASGELIAVRLKSSASQPDEDARGLIRFRREEDGIRLVSAGAEGMARFVRVPPLYRCPVPVATTAAAVPVRAP